MFKFKKMNKPVTILSLIVTVGIVIGGFWLAMNMNHVSAEEIEPEHYLSGDKYYSPFYTDEGEYIEPMTQYAYALEINSQNSDSEREYYTRDQLKQFADEGIISYNAEIRQPHIQPVPAYIEYQHEIYGSNAPLDLCDNTYYCLINEQRVCCSCGYIFTEEQDKEIGLKN